MKGLADCVIEKLVEDGELVISRAQTDDGSSSWLLASLASDRSVAGLAKLQHAHALREELDFPGAARPLELTEFQGRAALLIEDPGGQFLSELLGRPLSVPEFLRLAIGIATALGGLHRRGLVHKDVKPANLIVDVQTGAAWLTGFGLTSRLSRHRQSPAPPEGIAGTLAYMAPEQTGRMGRSIDARSDLYSLGVTLYEMLVGTPPFTASDPMEWVHCHIARPPVPPRARRSDIPEPLSAVVAKLLAKAPEDRFQTATGLAADLRRCLAAWEADGRIEPFALGTYDLSEQLLIPEKLYGREREVERLLAAFDRVVGQGHTELVLVSGYSGIGKSAVVNELHKALVPPRGLFALGKFDQYKRDIPYATLAQAFQGLVQQILAQSDPEVILWREALNEALGSNGSLIVNLIPEIELIIGKQSPVLELPPPEAKNRFHRVLRRFIGVFARPEHPLALFLDDLQWLDPATLDLLEHLVTEPEMRHLLLVGAYRDNEVGSTHPLTKTLETIRLATTRLHEIVISPLRLDDAIQLVSDALHSQPDQVLPLAQLVHEKTSGNPFFAIQFITTLADEGVITFDPQAGAWTWNLARTRTQGVTDNVVDLVVEKLNRLPSATLEATKQLACLGSSAQTALLSMVLGVSEEETHAALREIVRAGLILRTDEAYAFLHDRVQEAAYALIPDGERVAAHLRIGKLLASRTPPAELDENIFEIVNHLNRGTTLIRLPAEREQAAELNLKAGKRAKAASAVASALTYVTVGGELLSEDGWARCPSLTFALALQRAECEYLTGALAAADASLAMLSLRAGSRAGRAAVTCLRVEIYTNLDRAERAVEIGIEYLQTAGVQWSPHPTDDEVKQELERIRQQLGSRPVEELVHLPPMTDPDSLATLDVLTSVHAPANFIDGNLLALVIGRMVNLSLKYGNSDGSCLAYVYLGMILGARFGDFRTGFRFGKVGVELMERTGLDRYKARVLCNFGNAINSWTRHVRTSTDLLRQGFETAQEAGDLTFMAYNFTNLVTALIATGDPLMVVQQEVEAGLALVQRAQFGTAADLILGQLGLVRALRGLTPDLSSFQHLEFDECQFERHLEENPGLAMAACWYWIRKLQARFYAGDNRSAITAASKAAALLWTSPAFFVLAEYHFYAALARAAHYDETSADERLELRAALTTHQEQLQRWAETGPENFADRASLVAAEIARIENRTLDAMHLYEQAIQSARTHGFVQNEGLIHEVAARFYAARGFETIALAYLREARCSYLRWGAEGKVRQIDERHPQLREDRIPNGSIGLLEPPVEDLDLLSLAKSAEVISEEIVLSKLIGLLMTIAVECAGAERGLLILMDDRTPQIEAEAVVREGQVEVTQREAAVTPEELPMSVLQFTMRTRESVILDDAKARHLYSEDDYVRRKRPRSVLCLPIVKQTKLMGAFYLENNLAPQVFTAGRVSVLNLLASRAAISLENARLYADLERENAERKRVEEKLRRSEGLMSEGQRIGRTGSWAWNIKTGKLTWSEEQKRIFGFPPDEEELTYDDLAGTIHPEDRATALRTIDEAARVGRSFDQEFRIVLPDGTIKFIHGSGRPVFDESGALVEYFGAVTEITDRKRSEDQLRRSAAFLAQAQRVTRTGSLWWKVSTGEIVWSEESYRLMEYPPTVTPTVELIMNRVHPHDRPLVQELIARSVRDGTNLDFKHRLLMPDGSVKHVRVILQTIGTDSGEFEFVGAVTDITEQHKTEADLEDALARVTESKDQLRTLIDTIPCHAWTAGPNGEGEFFSRRWLDYTGMSLEEVQGNGWANAIHPDDVGLMVETWQKIVTSKQPGEVEARMRRFDGAYRWYLFRGAPLLDSSGEIVKWYGTNVDIDGLKRAETLLAGEKRLFEMIATGAPLEATLEALCQVVEELADGSLSSILLLDESGKRLRYCVSPSLPTSYTKAIDGGLIGPFVGSCGTAAYWGEKVYVSDIARDPLWAGCRDLALQHDLRACWSTPILSSDRSVLGTFIIYSKQARAITPAEVRITEQFTDLASIVVERNRAEDALRKSEAFLAEGQKISHTGSWAWNLATDKVVWSDEHCRIFGYRLDEVGGRFADVLARMLPEEREYLQDAVGEAVRRGEDFHIEYQATLPNGSTKQLHSVGRAIVNDAGEPVEYIGTTMDITERKRVEDELRRSEMHLRKAQAELAHVARTTTMGELAASIAHEVSQPLTGIVIGGNASLRWLAADSPNIDEAREAIQRVIREGKRTSEVIARIRKLFRKEAPTKERLDINEVIQEVIVLTRSELHKNDIALRLHLPADVPTVLGDCVQIQQVLMNLLLNAIDAMSSCESGSRELSITTIGEDGDHVCVEVRDTGMGVAAKDAERIFEPFHTSKAGGMGMGLSICRTIVEDHGGRLRVVPHEEPGARFQFTLLRHR